MIISIDDYGNIIVNLLLPSFSKGFWRATALTFLTLSCLSHMAVANPSAQDDLDKGTIQAKLPLSNETLQDEANATVSLVDMPEEIVENILSFLPLSTLFKARLASFDIRRLADSLILQDKKFESIEWGYLPIKFSKSYEKYFTTETRFLPLTVPKLSTLSFIGNKINVSQARLLSQKLQDSKIHTVTFMGSKLGNDGAIAIAQDLKNTTVHTIVVSNDQLDEAGAVTFAQHLQGTKVHTVNLSHNKLGNTGAIAIIKHLKNTVVKKINLEANDIDDTGVTEFTKNIQDTKVSSIHLTGNKISKAVQTQLKINCPHIKWILEDEAFEDESTHQRMFKPFPWGFVPASFGPAYERFQHI